MLRRISRRRVVWLVAAALVAGAALVVPFLGRRSPPGPVPVLDLVDPRQLEPCTLNKELRRALVMPGGGQVDVPLGPLAQDTLWTAVGVRRSRFGPSATAAFEVSVVDTAGTEHSLARRVVRTPEHGRTSAWVDLHVDLSSLPRGGRRLRLHAAVDGPGGEALWARPLLYARRAPSRWPAVILVSIDTLGARHTSLDGNGRETTPELARFARDAVVFEQAITAQSWTLTAHVSLLTSLYADTHRVSIGHALPHAYRLLPDVLADHGYATLGLVNNPYLNPMFGYGRAFDVYNFDHQRTDAHNRRVKRSIEESNRILERWIEAGVPRPFFLLYHVIDAHADWRDLPYEAPEPFADRFVPPRLLGLRLPPDPAGKAPPIVRLSRGEPRLSADERTWLEARYEGGVAYTDHHLGRFFDFLRQEGLYDDALIVVVSDHGEEFLEHGRLFHTQGYEECLRVPLLVKLPHAQFAGHRVSHQVHLIDVMPTVLEALGLPSPEQVEGHSLLPVIRGQAPPEPIVFAKGENYSMTPDDVYVARSERWKLIWWMASDRTELYDLARDPDERHDLASAEPDVVARMLGRLETYRRARHQGFRLRVPAYREGELVVRLRSDARFVEVTPRTDNPRSKARPRPSLSADGRRLSLTVHPAPAWDHPLGVDFDLDAPDAHLSIDASLDGRALEPGQLRLGAERTLAPALPLTVVAGDGTLRVSGARPVEIEASTPSPRIYLWEARLPTGADLKLSRSDEEALRALGYVR